MNVTVIVTKFLFKSTFPIPEFISSTIVSVPVVARDGAVAHLDAVEMVEVVVVVVLHAQIHKVGVVGEEALPTESTPITAETEFPMIFCALSEK